MYTFKSCLDLKDVLLYDKIHRNDLGEGTLLPSLDIDCYMAQTLTD